MASISDFFGEYPEITNPDFNSYISRKQEFRELSAAVIESPPKRGQMYKHQSYVVRYITWYDHLLVVHEPGTGKSCIIVQAAELYKRKYLENDQDLTAINRCIILIKGPTLEQNIKDQIVCKCTDRIYETDAVLRANDETARKSAITKELRKWYDIMTYDAFYKIIRGFSTDAEIEEYMSNKIIFCDEAHNIITLKEVGRTDIPIVEDDLEEEVNETLTIYEAFFKSFHMGRRNKIYLFTATPMINSTKELPLLMNLLLPLNKQMPRWSEDQMKFITLEQIQDYLIGYVSYMRALDTGVVRDYQGQTIRGYLSTLYPCSMSKEQYRVYLDSTQTKLQSFYVKQQQISNLIYPDGSYGPDGARKYVNIEKGKYMSFKQDANGELLQQYYSNLDYLATLSAKGAEAVAICKDAYADQTVFGNPKNEITNDHGIVFVYSPNFAIGSGVVDFALMLVANGYEIFKETRTIFQGKATIRGLSPCNPQTVDSELRKVNIPKAPRVAIITGDTSAAEIHTIFETLNSKENMFGEYIQVIVASKVGQEGININNAVAMIMFSSAWNPARILQAENRVFRSTSHIDRLSIIREQLIASGENPEDATFTVKVYLMCAVYEGDPEANDPELREPNLETVDSKMYIQSEGKDRDIRHIMRFIKQSDIGCEINYNRNVRPTDRDNSPVCDYQECAYRCAGIRQEILNKVDWTTKILYYSEGEVIAAEQAIRRQFSYHYLLTVDQLTQLIPEINQVFIVMAIEKILRENQHIIDRFGFYSFLRHTGDTLYLEKDSFNLRSSIEDSIYTNMLIGTMDNKHNAFADYITGLNFIHGNTEIEQLINSGPNHPEFYNQLAKLSLVNKVRILEAVLYDRETTETTNDFSNAIINEYNYSIYRMAEPVSMLEEAAHNLANQGRGRGRPMNPNNKTKVKKIGPDEIPLPVYDPNSGEEQVIIHTMLNQISDTTGYNDTSQFLKAVGRLRILKPSEGLGWRDVNVNENLVYNQLIQRVIQQIQSHFEQFNVYGLILPPKYNFQIRDKDSEDPSMVKKDPRKLREGKVCSTWNKLDLVELMYRIGYRDPVKSTYNQASLINSLVSTLQKPVSYFNDMSYDQLVQYYLLSLPTKDIICTRIKQFLEERGRIFTGKIPQASQVYPVGTVMTSEDQTDIPTLSRDDTLPDDSFFASSSGTSS